MLCPVREGGRDGARDGERDDGDQDLKLSRMVDLDGKRRNFLFWPDMLVASKVTVFSAERSAE